MQNSFKASALFLAFALAACSNDNAEQNKTQETANEPEASTEVTTEVSSADAHKEQNLAYLEENKAKDGVVVTDSGLQYRILQAGTGPVPAEGEYVVAHYAGRFIDGREFDSSFGKEPIIHPADGFIKGWNEALSIMPVGSKWELVIPAEIAYGSRGAGGVIPPNSTLVFEMELLDTLSEDEAKARMEEQQQAMIDALIEKENVFLENNAKQDGVTATASGLQYRVVEKGQGGKSPSATSKVTVHYAGRLLDGTEFDSSYKRGEPIDFPLNGVIPGWTEGVQLMEEGDKFEFFIPYKLAYGERGSGRSVPPYATLIFTVELISVDS